MKAPRSKNGGEYVLNEFNNFCALEGIQWELISPHNPQQNGLAEKEEHNYFGSCMGDVT